MDYLNRKQAPFFIGACFRFYTNHQFFGIKNHCNCAGYVV